MISRKTANRLVKDWFSTEINYGTLPSLIFQCSHWILTRHAYCQDDSRKIMNELPGLLEFLKHEKDRYDSKPTWKSVQRIMNAYFSNGQHQRSLEVLPRITKTKDGAVLFIVFEEYHPVSKYKYLSPLYSVWVWRKDERPMKLCREKTFSKQYVFDTLKGAKALLNSLKSEY